MSVQHPVRLGGGWRQVGAEQPGLLRLAGQGADEQKQVRLHLAEQVAFKIKDSLNLLGIEAPQRM